MYENDQILKLNCLYYSSLNSHNSFMTKKSFLKILRNIRWVTCWPPRLQIRLTQTACMDLLFDYKCKDTFPSSRWPLTMIKYKCLCVFTSNLWAPIVVVADTYPIKQLSCWWPLLCLFIFPRRDLNKFTNKAPFH